MSSAVFPDVVKYHNGNSRTLIHEIGHWLRLRHTNFAECDTKNDGISDTPAHILEGLEVDGCPDDYHLQGDGR